MLRFSLLHPSRNRTRLAERALREWTGKSSGTNEIEYILSIDSDDDDVEGYRRLAAGAGARILVQANRSLVQAANRAAEKSTGDILIVVSDDFGCPALWDVEIAAVVGNRRDVAVLVHDGIDGRILTLPILGRDLYQQLGYVYHPDYFSLYCDDDLTRSTELLGKLVDARHLLFPHRHYSIGATPLDGTYLRGNDRAAWQRGRRTFEQRKAVRFGLGPRTLGAILHQSRAEVTYWAHRLLYRARDVVRPGGRH
jgi:glycosyltransferase involved in cell wall biosynthesis